MAVPSSPRPKEGFALVLALSLMAFILLLLVSLVTFARVETQSAAVNLAVVEARRNAEFALEIAMGQLQKHAGADQRASFSATSVYPKKDVVEAEGELYDNGGFGYRSFAIEASSTSGRDNGTTYLTEDERGEWNDALADWWNSDDAADDITTGKNPYWTGIVDTSYRVDRFSSLNPGNNSFNYESMDRQDYESLGENTKFGEFARVGYLNDDDDEIAEDTKQLPIWLVSGNESKDPTDADYFRPDQDLNAQNLNADEIVTMVNRSAPGIEQIDNSSPDDDPVDNLAGRVTVPKVEIEGTSGDFAVGHYAYWVSDESTKANFSVRDPFENVPVDSSEYRNRLQVPQRVGWDRMRGFSEEFDNMSESERTQIDDELEKVASTGQIALVDPRFGDQNNDPDVNDSPVYRNLHHITGFSQGLLTNTARGGLRRDLTAFFQRNDGTMPSDYIADPDLYENDPRFAAFGGDNTGFPNPPTGNRFDYGIPTWDEVEEWYDNAAGGTGGSIQPSRNAHPMITYVNIHMGFSYRPSDQTLMFHIAPMVILWNPYDVGLDGTEYLLDIGVNPNLTIRRIGGAGDVTISAASHMDWDYRVNSRNGLFSPFSKAPFYSGNPDAEFTQPHNSGYKPLNELLRFVIPADRADFLPGESKVFVIGANALDWKPDDDRVELTDVFIASDPSGPGRITFPALTLSATGELPSGENEDGVLLSGPSGLTFDEVGLSHNTFASPYLALGVGSELPNDQFSQVDGLLFQSIESGDVDHTVIANFLQDREIPFDNNVARDFQPQNTQTQQSAFMFPFSRVWVQPFTGDGESPYRMHTQLPALANFNVSRPATAHPSIDAFRSRNPGDNNDELRRLSFMQAAPTSTVRGDPPLPDVFENIAWDEGQTASGSDAFSLITFKGEETIDDASFLGQETLPLRNARRADSEILSLGRMQEINLSRYFWQPFAPIGNANAPIYVDREAIAGLNGQRLSFTELVAGETFNPSSWFRFQGNRSEQQISANVNNRPYLDRWIPANLSVDMSYLLNESIWDDFFFSTIVDNNPDPTQELPNSRMGFTVDAFNPTSGNLSSDVTDFETAAAYLRYKGPLNVNSTSVEAWKALLTAFRNLELGDNPNDTVPIARTLDPIEDAIDFSNNGDIGAVGSGKDYSKVVGGVRYLDDTQIENLAERIVDEVRLRGPFFSIADFVNRRLVSPERGSAYDDARSESGNMSSGYDPFRGLQGLNGALQRAINVSGINGGVNHPDPAAEDRVYSVRIDGDSDNNPKHSIEPSTNSHVDMEHVASAPVGEAGQLFNGAPGFVTQGDLLSMIGPALTARGDTFLIRTYGDSINPTTGEVEGQAWLEAVVQRTIEPVNPTGGNDFRYADSFGRKFEVVSVRWLSEEEI